MYCTYEFYIVAGIHGEEGETGGAPGKYLIRPGGEKRSSRVLAVCLPVLPTFVVRSS